MFETSQDVSNQIQGIQWEEFDNLDYTTGQVNEEAKQNESAFNSNVESAKPNYQLDFIHQEAKNSGSKIKFKRELRTYKRKIVRKLRKIEHNKPSTLETGSLDDVGYPLEYEQNYVNQDFANNDISHDTNNKFSPRIYCNFNCLDIEDRENVMQEFYGQENDNLHQIEEESIELSENSGSYREHLDPYLQVNEPEIIILEGMLKKFYPNSQNYTKIK